MKRTPFKSLAIRAYDLIPEGCLKRMFRVVAIQLGMNLPRRVLVNRGNCVLQVGTPSPETIRWYLEIVGPTGRVIVVEPEEKNFLRLTSDPIIAKATNATLLRRAAWCRRESISLTVSKSDVDHKIEVPGVVHDNDYVPDNYCGRQTVQADTVDNILTELGVERVDYAEIHVNGAELEVLSGMAGALQRTSRLHVKGHALFRETSEPLNMHIARLLQERGFRTTICPRSRARVDAAAHDWQHRAGDVYAAR